jgi:hypothetical protein
MPEETTIETVATPTETVSEIIDLGSEYLKSQGDEGPLPYGLVSDDLEPKGEEANEDEAETEVEKPTGTETQNFDIDGQTVTLEDLTKAYKEHSSLSEGVKLGAQWDLLWNQGGPEGKIALFQSMRQELAKSGIQLPGETAQPNVNAPLKNAATLDIPEIDLGADPYEGDVKIVDWVKNVFQAQEARHQQQLTDLHKALEPVKGFVAHTQAEKTAQAAAATIKAQYGQDISPQQLIALSDKTGITDPISAWRSENFDSMLTGVKPTTQTVKRKPNSPTVGAKTFDPNAEGMTADRISALMQQGFEPIRR